MKQIGHKLIPVSQLKDNPFRKYLGPVPQEDVDQIAESATDLGFWPCAIARRLSDGTYELGNAHRRIQYLRDKRGDSGTPVMIYEFSDREMLLVLARSNPFKYATKEEREGMVTITKLFLTEYASDFDGSVDFRLLNELLENGQPGDVPHRRLADFLGPKAWPQQRISEIIGGMKVREQTKNETLDPFIVLEPAQSFTDKTQEIKTVPGAAAAAYEEIMGRPAPELPLKKSSDGVLPKYLNTAEDFAEWLATLIADRLRKVPSHKRQDFLSVMSREAVALAKGKLQN